MLVTVTGIGVDLGYSGEADCFLRTVLYAGEAEIAVALCLYPLGCKGIVTLRTNMGAYSAPDTVVMDYEFLLASLHKRSRAARPLHEIIMYLSFFLGDRFMPVLLFSKFRFYTGQVLRNLLVDLHLLVHVEVGQPVVNHYNGGDVIECLAVLFGYIIQYFHGITFAGTVCCDRIFSISSGVSSKSNMLMFSFI